MDILLKKTSQTTDQINVNRCLLIGLAVGLFAVTERAADAKPLPFAELKLPAGGVKAWHWVGGDGTLAIDENGRLVLRAFSLPQGRDNRVGATIALVDPDLDSFVLDVSIDPASNIRGVGCNQLDCGITIGLPDLESDPNRFQASSEGLSLNIRDLSDRADFGVFLGNRDLCLPIPVTRGTGNPRAFNRHDGAYRFRMIVTPAKQGSRIRVYHTQFVDPDWETILPKKIVAGHLGIYGRLAQHSGKVVETTIASLSIRPLDPQQAAWQPSAAESVLHALDLDFPGLEKVKATMDRGDILTAGKQFADYLRRRTNVVGPSVAKAPLTQREQQTADLMAADKILVYTGGPLFEHRFGNPYDWSVDPYKTGGQFAIYNSRMFPWLNMGRAFLSTGDPKYVRTFIRQLNSWLDQIPLRIVAKPGDPPFFVDGNTLEPPLLFTGNMGRRIELTWWQAFELFKQAPDFDDDSLLRMMKYFQENARLVTNPSIFFAWDDSGLHMATGLLQCSTMMPEWRESARWKEIAFNRLEQTFASQVHADGTHASLSTGYGWATIDSYRNVFEIMRRNQQEIPAKFVQAIRGMIMGYMAVLRPDFGNISLNDGGWSPVDDKVREYSSLFPGDEEIDYFASRGKVGEAPEWTSRYFPNAGWYVMRTGYGPREKMLFMDGGPFGASHGKQDALHLVVACGDSLLLRDGGRGDYTQKPTSRWASKTLAFNTLTPDWALQDRTPRYEHEKHVGFNPPSRPWISNDEFDYGRSTYDAGWYLPGKRIGGRHTRHIVFLKGKNPPATGYWIVVDRVEPGDEARHKWRHPWHLSTEEFSTDDSEGSFATKGAGANLRVLPVDPDKNVKLSVVRGQTEPALQGWKVHGSEAKPASVPMHTWSSEGAFTKAWILLPRNADQKIFEVKDVTSIKSDVHGLSFTLNRNDGGQDKVLIANRSPDSQSDLFFGREIRGSIAVLRRGKDSRVEAVLEVD